MNARQFFDLVSQMREAQQNYFALRKQKADKTTVNQALQYSIGLEQAVDAEITRVRNILTGQNKQQQVL